MTKFVERLRPHVAAILDARDNGDQTAAHIITLYRMWEQCPTDHAAQALCEATFNDWLKRTGRNA